MEVRCPECSQRLRYADSLSNPLLRCGNCGTTFRPHDLPSQREPIAMAVAVEELPEDGAREFQDVGGSQFPVAPPGQKTTDAAKKSGWGTAAVVITVLLFKAGPKLFREFQREAKPDPPVRVPAANQPDLQKLMQEARKNMKNRRVPAPPDFDR